jgi:hypothetical protein
VRDIPAYAGPGVGGEVRREELRDSLSWSHGFGIERRMRTVLGKLIQESVVDLSTFTPTTHLPR